VCLFTCAVTRAVHLEILTDLSTKNFLQAFRRFSSRKSLPAVMISDNVSTYLAAADELEELFSSKSLLDVLSRKGVTWRFIPKRAPWFGGVLGTPYWVNKGRLHQESAGEIVCEPPQLADYRGRNRSYPQRLATNVCFTTPL